MGEDWVSLLQSQTKESKQMVAKIELGARDFRASELCGNSGLPRYLFRSYFLNLTFSLSGRVVRNHESSSTQK